MSRWGYTKGSDRTPPTSAARVEHPAALEELKAFHREQAAKAKNYTRGPIFHPRYVQKRRWYEKNPVLATTIVTFSIAFASLAPMYFMAPAPPKTKKFQEDDDLLVRKIHDPVDGKLFNIFLPGYFRYQELKRIDAYKEKVAKQAEQ